MMEFEQFPQTRVSEPVPFQSHYKHLLIFLVPEAIYEREIKHAGKTVENKVK